MTFDERVAAELLNTLEERYGRYSAPAKAHWFSVAYRIKRRCTIRAFERGYAPVHRLSVRTLRYALLAAVLAVTLLVGFSTWFTLWRFSFNVRSDHSVVYIMPSENDKTRIEEVYGLPEELGWSVTEHYEDEEVVITHYQLGEQKVVFGQMLIGDKYVVNTEYGMPEEVLVNGCEGYFISMSMEENQITFILNGYLILLHGKINKENLIDLANCIKIKNY